jgi:RNA polymerase sigma factor (sigma-70 family)
VPHPALSNVLRSLRGAAAAAAGVPDAELLERFAAGGDPSAFELLLWRHGPMVYGVCRRVLRHEHDAEDAFQAAFLALARKARSVTRRGSVGGWLYRVAYRVSLDARERAARRARHERAAVPGRDARGAPDPPAEAAGNELWRALDAELGRLPERCRAAFVLCCLEGRSVPEAARELGCAAKALESRLTRARARLRAGLTRRGLLASAGLAAAALVPGASGAAVPGHLVAAALRTVAFSSGRAAAGAAVSAHVLSLTEGVLRTMLLSKLKVVGAILVAAGVVGAGAGGLGYRTWAGEGPGDGGPAQARPQPGTTAPHANGVALTLDGAELTLSDGGAAAGPGDELRQLKDLMDQQKALADWLEALARRLQAKEAAGKRPPASDTKTYRFPPRSGGELDLSLAMMDFTPALSAEQQRRLRALEAAQKALRELSEAMPANAPQWQSVHQVVALLQSVRAQLQQAGLLGAAAGQPAAAPDVGSVRDVTPGGFVVLALTGAVRVGQALHVVRPGGDNAGPAGQLTVVAVSGPEAVARAVAGQPQRGDRVLDASDGSPQQPFPNVQPDPPAKRP